MKQPKNNNNLQSVLKSNKNKYNKFNNDVILKILIVDSRLNFAKMFYSACNHALSFNSIPYLHDPVADHHKLQEI